ncbi:MAG: FixH family protein [Phycisphaerales bacterium]|nr:FixH family protein [Phycisphaerales bacterium]
MTADAQTTDSWLKRYLASGKHWPIMLVVLFVTQASIVIGTAIVASGPGAKPIDAGYYAKSLDWDSEHAERLRADELGWTITTEISEPVGVPPQRVVRVRLLDREGAPVEHAVIRMKCYHRAYSTDAAELVLVPTTDGAYEASVVVRNMGLWDFHFVVRANGEDAVIHELVEIGG